MLRYRKPSIEDIKVYFDWANDAKVREQSYNSSPIDMESHKHWFETVLASDKCFMYLFQNEAEENIGQVRIQIQNRDEAIIGISIDPLYRGKGYSREMLESACESFLNGNRELSIHAFIKVGNLGSKRAFEQSGFNLIGIVKKNNHNSYHYIKKNNAN